MWLELHGHYENGHLWRPGGIASQPYRYLRGVAIVGEEIKKLEEEQRRKRDLGK